MKQPRVDWARNVEILRLHIGRSRTELEKGVGIRRPSLNKHYRGITKPRAQTRKAYVAFFQKMGLQVTENLIFAGIIDPAKFPPKRPAPKARVKKTKFFTGGEVVEILCRYALDRSAQRNLEFALSTTSLFVDLCLLNEDESNNRVTRPLLDCQKLTLSGADRHFLYWEMMRGHR
jgi:hypothetical protein